MSPEDAKAIPLLSAFPADELSRLLQNAREFVVPPGKFIFRQGDPSTELYVVVRGKVRFEYDVPEGGVSVLSDVSDGMFFGEVAFLHSLPRTATAIAEKESKLIAFDQQQLQNLIDHHPTVAAFFYRTLATELAKRLREVAPRIL